jgi:hypothetical protein
MKVRDLVAWGGATAIATAVLSVLLMLGASDSNAQAGEYNPKLISTTEDNTPEVSSNFSTEFSIEKGNVIFGGVVAFVPPETGIIPGDKIPVGGVVGSLNAQATLGLINGACNTSLAVDFTFLNASINREHRVSFNDLDDLSVGNAGGFGTRDFAEDKNGDTLLDAIDFWPDFIERIIGDTQPIRRSAAVTPVAGTPVLLQFLIFPPGTQFDLPNSQLEELLPHEAALGYPTFVLLQAAGDPDADPEPGVISDFCTPLVSKNNTLGVSEDNPLTEDVVEESVPLFVNPQNGKYTFSFFSVGLRDAEGDTYENFLDTCPYDVNAGDPREQGGGDGDLDGLDATCDPNDDYLNGGSNTDQDADGYQNRQDNCPNEPNGQDLDNQHDTDFDQIGDACDTAPDVPDGELHQVTNSVEIIIGDGTGPGGPPSAAACPDCWKEGYVFDLQVPDPIVKEGEDSPTPEVTGDTAKPTDGGTGGGTGEDGSNTGLIVGAVAVAAVVVLGGGAFVAMRRRGGG